MKRPRNITDADRLRAILEKNLMIAEAMADKALALAMSGEDIRANKERPSMAGYQHSQQKAIDEIVRLRLLIDDVPNDKPTTYILKFANMESDGEKE